MLLIWAFVVYSIKYMHNCAIYFVDKLVFKHQIGILTVGNDIS